MILDIAYWTVIALLALGPLLAIMMIGKPRDPITPGTAAFQLVFNAAIVLVLVLSWHR